MTRNQMIDEAVRAYFKRATLRRWRRWGWKAARKSIHCAVRLNPAVLATIRTEFRRLAEEQAIGH